MREFTEIQISKLKMNSTDEVMLKKYICFDYVQSNTTFAKFIGVPVAFENNVLKLSTQMYREDISFSEMNYGTQIKLFDGLKKSESWGDGIVVSKYYVPATLDSFNIGKKISSNNSFEITVDIILIQIKWIKFAIWF